MLINGVDISSLGIQLYDRVLTSNQVKTTQDWLDGDVQPTFIRQQDNFKNIQLKFLITEQNEENAFILMSKLAMMLKKASIIFDDIDLQFDTVLIGTTSQERLKNGNFILTANLQSDYAKGLSEVYTTDTAATDYFYLNVIYYQNNKTLIGTEKVLIKASQFTGKDTIESLGIEVNKYQPNYYNSGNVTNFSGQEVTYENLKKIQNLVINYSPIVYSKEVNYYLAKDGIYNFITSMPVTFTKAQVDNATTIGQIIDLSANKPDGYKASTSFTEELTFDNLMKAPIIEVYYSQIENERTKDITVTYSMETDDGSFVTTDIKTVVIKESDIFDGVTLEDIVNIDAFKPKKYYDSGVIVEHDPSALVTFDTLELNYVVNYSKTENIVLVEYYLGTYPNWSRITTATYKVKYKPAFDVAEDIIAAVGVDINKYHTETYKDGIVKNQNLITDFDSLLNIGVLQVYYEPKDYTIQVSYLQENKPLGVKDVVINDYMFLGNPSLGQVIDINAMRPEGFIFDPNLSYSGPVTLSALTAASPITITYVPVEQVRTKSIVVKYKQELASAYSTVNTSVITIEEGAIGGGTTLGDLINLNAYKPEYYDNGIVDGYSSTALITFEELQGTYDVLYLASTYQTQVRYFTDVVDNGNWIGSSTISYRIIDFTTSTTLIDLGLDVNAFKPSYCGDGEVDYKGNVTFSALVNLDAINVVYTATSEPVDPDVKYPHRILFLQHNDMGGYESQFPNWTLNHAYINTGVTVPDMSKLTVLCDTVRVFETEPLYNVNVGEAYLFGSMTPNGNYYIKYVNNTTFKQEELLTGENTFNVAAGVGTPELIINETASEGFSKNTGITASNRPGYSYATLTYTNLVQSNDAPMNVPLYLFACNSNGFYRGGIAGVGIKSCKIYYDNTLIRDYVPVTFFDKIGDKVAPSNCLYDKISQTFFEDARKMNSFNIMDDPDYPDDDPSHKIGCCYVNYYKDTTLFQQSTIWFRGDEFLGETPYDPYEKFFVDYYQPQFYGSGTIKNLADIGSITFENMKNKVFDVVYTSTGYNVVVNYYQDSKDNPIATDVISLTEKDFYQVPTFGDLIPLQKYKPDGYKATYDYPETKVTLTRIMEHSPYDIIYTKVDNPATYTTQIKYYKKVFGRDVLDPIKNYALIKTETITIDETQFADGVYVEDFVDMDKYYPTSPIENKPFYTAGTPYEWYLKDERLTTPKDLKTEYKISYEPVPLFIDVNYFTDVAEEGNLIASTTWKVQVDDWREGAQFYIVDELPNSYIDRYKPVICDGGQLTDPSKLWTFEELIRVGNISIIYQTLEEPHDPESTMFPSKVIWYNIIDTAPWNRLEPFSSVEEKIPPHKADSWGAFLPYLDLGYTPKEIGRLRMETKAYSLIDGCQIQASGFGAQVDDFSYFLGYYGGIETQELDQIMGTELHGYQSMLTRKVNEGFSDYSNNSYGWMGFKGHHCRAGFLVWSNPYPQMFDGHSGWNLGNSSFNDNYDLESVKELVGGFRRGLSKVRDSLGNLVDIHSDYVISQYERDEDDKGVMLHPNTLDEAWQSKKAGGENLGFLPAIAFNPTTMTLDAYNNYAEYFDYKNSMHPKTFNLATSDNDLFNTREKPKTSITAFLSSNPATGTLNRTAFSSNTYLAIPSGSLAGGGALGHLQSLNPWDDGFTGSITYETQVITGKNEDGTPIYETRKVTKNIEYITKHYCANPVPIRTMIWYIKVWDRNKLVRNLIPIAKGDNVYSFTAPDNGMFDLVTETFYANQNKGGKYSTPVYHEGEYVGQKTLDVQPEDIVQFKVNNDPTIWGKVVVNYYDNDNNFLGNQYVEIPITYSNDNISAAALLHYNDFKPNEFYHDGMVDVDADWAKKTVLNRKDLKDIFDTGAINVYYKLITFTKTAVYYHGNSRVGSKDLFYSIKDIQEASTLADLGLDVDLYASEDYAPGRIVFDESVIKNDDIQTFIDASSPIVVYDKLTKEQAPNILYVDYYRAGAYDDQLITLDEQNPNYLNCQLDATVLNPEGCIKYINHYHSALYEDEKQDYFIAYQVDVQVNLLPVRKGPHYSYATLAEITDKGRYTIVEEQDGWGRLKEYLNGWIMLSYTKPVAGPGQNPDYEDPDLSNVTIPFGSKISISRLTIDRLWAYCPAEASWIKTEEISCDQDGKLYRALHSDAIHLDTLDWTAIKNFSDMGIHPQAYKLKYHDDCDETYNGEFTLAAFKDLHSIEFVYPETIYAYNCIYYKDLVRKENEVGRESFSISISDWNPDWDTFIDTSYKKEIVNEFPTVINDHYKTVSVKEAPNDESKELTVIPGGYTATVHGEIVNTGGVEWYPVIYDDVGTFYEGFCKKELLTVIPTETWYRDINPTLYRETPLTLTWDYFGMQRNKYKPEIGNYDDGMYLWNPRSYNNDDVYFTFEELVTTGVQNVLYLHTLQEFKMVGRVADKKIKNYEKTGLTEFKFKPSPDIADVLPGTIDLELKTGATDFDDRYEKELQIDYYSHIYPHSADASFTYAETNSTSIYPNERVIHRTPRATDLPTKNFYDYVITNISDKRNNTIVYSYGRDTTGFKTPFYGVHQGGGSGKPTQKLPDIKLDRTINTSLPEFDLLRPTKWIANLYKYYIQWQKAYGIEDGTYDITSPIQVNYPENLTFHWADWDGTKHSSHPEFRVPWNNGWMRVLKNDDFINPKEYWPLFIPLVGTIETPFFYLKVWNNFYLTHYYVPIARGQWLADGRQVPYNTIYDVITNTYIENPVDTGFTPEPGRTPITSSQYPIQLYKVGSVIADQNIYSPFDTWYFETTDCKYTVKTNKKVTVYKYPDVLSTVLTTYEQDTVIPIRKQTEDAENRVAGLWYSDGEGWIQAENVAILPADSFVVTDYVPALDLAVKGDKADKQSTYKAYIDPTLQSISANNTFVSEQVNKFRYESGEAYWNTLSGWVPIVYTENGFEDINIKYVVSADYLEVYSHPIRNDIYKIKQMNSGDRITAIKKLTKDNNWKYIENCGWAIANDSTVQEIVE